MTEQPVGVAIIGTGGVATLHADAINRVPSLRLIGAVSRDRANVQGFAERNGCRGFSSHEELLGDPAVDVVAVCSPAEHHVSHAIAALRAGKHVIVEKPVGGSVEEIDMLQTEAAHAGRLCVPCHNYIYAPALQRAKALVDEGRLGRIASFWLVYNQRHDGDAGKPGMALHELMVHHAYAVLHFLGRPQSVTAAAANLHFDDPAADDQVMLVCTMADGAIANLWGSFAADDRGSDPWSVLYKILGTDGGVTYTWDEAYTSEVNKPGWDKPAYRDSFRFVYEHFASRCLAAGEAPLSTLADARDALCLVQAAEQALARRVAVDYASPRRPD